MNLELRDRCPVDDAMVNALHTRAFGNRQAETEPWSRRLENHSLTWVAAFEGKTLAGFVYACWDGGRHAFLLDPVVDPAYQRRGIGKALVEGLARDAAAAGCTWLHVDYQPHLAAFYEEACGFRTTNAGLRKLN
jgi:GNAT superfamily N-acetyltransferase